MAMQKTIKVDVNRESKMSDEWDAESEEQRERDRRRAAETSFCRNLSTVYLEQILNSNCQLLGVNRRHHKIL